jgi:predicted KAP-like P-loop ATPase
MIAFLGMSVCLVEVGILAKSDMTAILLGSLRIQLEPQIKQPSMPSILTQWHTMHPLEPSQQPPLFVPFGSSRETSK